MASPNTDLWKKAKDLEFTVQRESWGTYEVDDDVLVRTRAILLKLLKIPGEGGKPPTYVPNAAVLLATDAPFKQRRAPTSPPPGPEQVHAAEKTEAQFRSIDEPWNEYLYEDDGTQLLRVKLVVSGVSRVTGLYDGFGCPIYQVSHATVVAPPVPRKVNPGK